MNNEPNKPIAAQELAEKELESIVGGKENSVATKLEAFGVDVPIGFDAPILPVDDSK